MQKNTLIAVITTYLLVFSSLASAGLITLDFDDIQGNGTQWGGHRYLSSHEIAFDGIGAPLYAFDDPSNGEYVATTGLTYIYAGGAVVGDSALTVTFFDEGDLTKLGVTNFLQFDVIDYASQNVKPWHYRVFDINGNTLFDETGTGSGQRVQVSTNSALIHGFTFTPSGETEGLDSFVFEEITSAGLVSVSEPSTLLLFALLVLGLFARKMKF